MEKIKSLFVQYWKDILVVGFIALLLSPVYATEPPMKRILVNVACKAPDAFEKVFLAPEGTQVEVARGQLASGLCEMSERARVVSVVKEERVFFLPDAKVTVYEAFVADGPPWYVFTIEQITAL